MAPAKKSKSVNKGFAAGNRGFSPGKDDKSKQKKRKLSDMLGPQWSKHELAHFYDAYRKHGHDWKKVAALVGSRSIDMVEALYNMNRAYLSLPEGTASVAGLIAMMTDHYNVIGGNGIERDGTEPLVMAHKFPKYSKLKGWEGPPEEFFQRQSTGASDRGLSALKLYLDGVQPSFPVRKRTPRVPVSSLDVHLNKNSRQSIMNKNQDAVFHGALLAKARQTPTHCEFECVKPAEVLTGEKVPSRFGMLRTNHSGTAVDEESPEDSLGSRIAKNGELIRDSMESNGGQKEKFGSKGACAKILSSSEGLRRTNKNAKIEDESVAFDALETLAEMSLMMPYLSAQAALKDKSAGGKYKKKRKSEALKIAKAGLHSDDCRKVAENQNLGDADARSAASSGQISTVSKRFKSAARSPDVSTGDDQHMGDAEAVASTSQVLSAATIANSTRRKHHRKRDKAFLEKDRSYTQSTCSSEAPSLLQEKVPHSLSWRGVRKWCVYEWFYSAIDYPWFAKREFVEYLNHVGLGHIPRLTRVEWGVIRSSLGKPRRFSERFLHEEREKLKQYRDSVRIHYANLRAGLGEGLPTDLARPLSVGQQVVAIHPKTREIHNGSVLTVDHHSCLVQFNRPDLGVEFVMDIDCMPINPVENTPQALRRQEMMFDCRYPQLPNANQLFLVASEEQMQSLQSLSAGTLFTQETKVNPGCASSYANLANIGGLRTASVVAQAQSCTVETVNLRGGDHMRPIPGSTQGSCRKGVEHRTCSDNSVGLLNGDIYSSSNNSVFRCQETASNNVAEIVGGSRDKAQKMVDIAIKTMSMMKEGEDAYGRIGEALLYAPTCKSSDTQRTSEPQMAAADSMTEIKPANDSVASDLQVPSDLIASCVANLLMIQTCTERQCPPSEVAQILDNAVRSLRPQCSQNLAIYREIQMCMGRIKTQILALVPT